MPNPIKPKRSYTTNSVPLTSDLDTHELAINWTDGKAYTKNAAGQIVTITLGGSGGGGEDPRWAYLTPAAPTSVTASSGNAQAVVSWTAPSSLVAISDYVVQYSSNSGSTWTTFADGTSATASATVTGLTNGTSYTFRVAAVSGIGQGAWSAASAAVTIGVDPYFANVALLLHMDGSGSTFVDSSPSPKTITAYGNATQSAAQGKWGGKSGYFDGSGDYLSIANTGALNLSSASEWAIEGWLYPTANQAYASIVAKRLGNNPTSYQIGFNNQYLVFWNGSNAIFSSVQGQLSQWSHFAVSYQSGTVRIYWNGALAGSDSSFVNEVDTDITIGRHFSSLEEAFAGYIDDLRITKGSARGYTGSTIPVPTAAFPDA